MNIYIREKRRPFELYPIRTYVIIQLRHDSLNKTPRRMKKKRERNVRGNKMSMPNGSIVAIDSALIKRKKYSR